LRKLWETGKRLSVLEESEQAKFEVYWSEIDKTRQIGNEGINFWKNKIAEFDKLSREDAIRLLIKSEKIEAKIKTIEKAINVKVKI
jgi:hypothetical protein